MVGVAAVSYLWCFETNYYIVRYCQIGDVIGISPVEHLL